MPRGGKRAGAGRKVGSTKKQSVPCGTIDRDIRNVSAEISQDDSSNDTGRRVQSSNQNEPKEIIKESEGLNLCGSTERESISPVSGSLEEREATGFAARGSQGLRGDSSREHSPIAEGSQGHPIRPSDTGELRVHGQGQGEVGGGKLLDQQIHSSKSSTEGSRGSDESTNRPKPANPSNTHATSLSFAEQVKRLRDPIYFARANCLSSLDPWQVKFLNDARTPGRSALRGANGIGKTVIICVLILFFLSTIKNCRVVIVSGVFRQLKMMVDHLQSLLKNFPGWRVLRGSHELLTPFPENKAIWFSTDSPGAAQGQHSVVESVNYEDENAYDQDGKAIEAATREARASKSCLILIRDECRDIPEGVKASTDTFGADWTFDLSCPGNAVGWFHQIFGSLAEIYRLHHVTAYESSYIKKEHIEEMKLIHGNSARFKNSVLAEFSDIDVKNLITIDQITRCFKNPQPWKNPGYKKAGIDLSAAKKGGDEMWCVPVMGNKLFQPYCLPHCESEMEAVGLVVRWLRAEKVKYVFCDNGGLGSPMISRLEEVLQGDESIEIIRVNFGGDARNPAMMAGNRGTELWIEGANKIELRDLVFAWDEPTKNKFVAQVTSREIKPVGSDGIIQLMPKAKCARSPDLADATFLALLEPPRVWPFKIGNTDMNSFRMPGGASDDDSDHQYNVSHDGFNIGGSL